MIVFALITTQTACGVFPIGGDAPKDKPPAGKDWFGNPLPSEDPTCLDPEIKDKPVPKGISKTLIILEVQVLDSTGKDICVPVQLHVYGRVADLPGLKIENGQPLPWDAVRATPWTSHMVIQYDRANQQPPEYTIDLISTFVPAPGIAADDLPDGVVLMCTIFVNALIADQHKSPINLRVPVTSSVHCRVNAIAQ